MAATLLLTVKCHHLSTRLRWATLSSSPLLWKSPEQLYCHPGSPKAVTLSSLQHFVSVALVSAAAISLGGALRQPCFFPCASGISLYPVWALPSQLFREPSQNMGTMSPEVPAWTGRATSGRGCLYGSGPYVLPLFLGPGTGYCSSRACLGLQGLQQTPSSSPVTPAATWMNLQTVHGVKSTM